MEKNNETAHYQFFHLPLEFGHKNIHILSKKNGHEIPYFSHYKTLFSLRIAPNNPMRQDQVV